MAATSKFELSSSSSDGPLVHSNGQRIAASLERPGSFREAVENRTGSSLASISSLRTGSVSAGQGDAASLLQSVVSDVKAAVGFDQKLSRHGEVRRSLGSILGIPHEDSFPASFTVRPLPAALSVEEIRRLRNNIQENSAKARYMPFSILSEMALIKSTMKLILKDMLVFSPSKSHAFITIVI